MPLPVQQLRQLGDIPNPPRLAFREQLDWRIETIVCPIIALFHRPDRDWAVTVITPSVKGFAVSAKEAPISIVQATWLASYRKVLAETGNEGEAKVQAERSVRRAHGSSARTDMYNRQILVDHFKGKRSADDPQVQREFQLLRQQAEIDWKEIYAGKNTPETPEKIAEDYIYNAKLTADTQQKMTKIKWIALLVVLAVIALVYVLNK